MRLQAERRGYFAASYGGSRSLTALDGTVAANCKADNQHSMQAQDMFEDLFSACLAVAFARSSLQVPAVRTVPCADIVLRCLMVVGQTRVFVLVGSRCVSLDAKSHNMLTDRDSNGVGRSASVHLTRVTHVFHTRSHLRLPCQ